MKSKSSDSPKENITMRMLRQQDPFLCDSSSSLFRVLRQAGFKFQLVISSKEKAWEHHRGSDFANARLYVIKANSSELKQEQLAHELLHVWMEMQGFTYFSEIGNKLCEEYSEEYIKVLNCEIFKDTQSRYLECNGSFVEFDNRLAHVKMLEQFVALGFNKADFLYSIPTFEALKQSYESKITLFDTSQIYDILLDYWSLRLIEKMETLPKDEIENLHELLRERSKSWYEFSAMMYELWEEEFKGIDNIGFYKRLVNEYDMQHKKLKVNPRE